MKKDKEYRIRELSDKCCIEVKTEMKRLFGKPIVEWGGVDERLNEILSIGFITRL